MKKLMLAAAIVCAAVASQAATCSWTMTTSGTLANPAGVTLTSSITTPQMYVFMTTATVADERKALLKSLKDTVKGGAAATTALSGAWQTATLTSGALAETEFTSDSEPGTAFNFYGVILGEDAAGNQYAYFTNSKSGNAIAKADGTTSIELTGNATTLKDLSTTTCKNAQWYQIAEAAAVPEPTSAMLLLLGVAGLALKRKRA